MDFRRVSGTCRSSPSLDHIQSKGWGAHSFDPGSSIYLSEHALHELSQADAIISSIPPLALPLYDPVLREQLRLLERVQPSSWVGYLSSTGVYGDHQGEWVDERSECKTVSGRGIVRKEHEDAWLSAGLRLGLPVHILRLGGIYGPARSILNSIESKAQQDTSTSKRRRAKQRFTSRVHVQDICSVVLASIEQPRPGDILNVVDDEPAPRQEVLAFALSLQEPASDAIQMSETTDPPASPESLAGVPLVETSGRETSPPETSQHQPSTADSSEHKKNTDASEGKSPAESSDIQKPADSSTESRRSERVEVVEEKRVRNTRIIHELGVVLQYPTYKEGISAIQSNVITPFTEADMAFLQGISSRVE